MATPRPLAAGPDPSAELVEFLAGLEFAALPPAAIERTEALFLDWLGSALAGRGARPVRILEAFAREMGPADGAAELLTTGGRTSPLFAALVNGAASHVVEQDDLHNASVLHPGTVVFPPLLAMAQRQGASGEQFLTAAVAGYEAGCRVGEFLGRSHYKVFHTTGTAGTLAAAAAVARLLDLPGERFAHALGSAGTQAAGLWAFLRDAADSKQLHTAKACADGLLAAWVAREGFTGARDVLLSAQGMAAGMSSDAEPAALTAGLGHDWAVLQTSFKWHASCRHTHPCADALLALVHERGLRPERVRAVRAYAYQAALDVLGPVTDPRTVHQAKFSMGMVLATCLHKGRAGLAEFDEASLHDPALRATCAKVSLLHDPDIECAYPRAWSGRVEVDTLDGETLHAAVREPRGDPGNPLTRADLEDKFRRLATSAGAAGEARAQALCEQAWRLHERASIGALLG